MMEVLTGIMVVSVGSEDDGGCSNTHCINNADHNGDHYGEASDDDCGGNRDSKQTERQREHNGC